MSRLRVGVLSAAAVAGAGLMLVIGPSWALGSARSGTAATTPQVCAPTQDIAAMERAGSTSAAHSDSAAGSDSAAPGDMAGMPGMAAGSPTQRSTQHSTQELRDGLARTPSGGTLTVQPGVYRGALVIDRPVTLVGIGHPILQGDGMGTVLTIRGAGTTVRDLMIEGSGPGPVDNPAGVSVQARNVVVKNLHIRDTYTGIWVEGVSDAQIIGNVIQGRKTVAVSGQTPHTGGSMAGMEMGPGHGSDKGGAQAGRGDGISLFNAMRPVVSGNTVADARDGVYLEYGNGTKIACNRVVGGRYAIHSMYGQAVTVTGNQFATNESGPVMMYGGPVTLEGNVIRDEQSAATGFGVLLLDVSGVRLRGNVLVSNRVGLQIEGPMGDPRPTAVERNTIALNQVGVGLYPTANAILSRNSLVENTVQVLGLGPDGSGGGSAWSSSGVGNYWSDYRGYERSGSGVGAIPHAEGAAAGRLLAGDPSLLALASSPSFTLLRAVEQRMAGQHPVSVDRQPLIDPGSPSLPSTTTHAALGTGLVGASSLVLCSLALLRSRRRSQMLSGRKSP
jgi:nitrous oxidase accessory protein